MHVHITYTYGGCFQARRHTYTHRTHMHVHITYTYVCRLLPGKDCPYLHDTWVTNTKKYVPFESLLSRDKHATQSSTLGTGVFMCICVYVCLGARLCLLRSPVLLEHICRLRSELSPMLSHTRTHSLYVGWCLCMHAYIHVYTRAGSLALTHKYTDGIPVRHQHAHTHTHTFTNHIRAESNSHANVYAGVARLAVDGNNNGYYSDTWQNSVTHTNSDSQAWWQVDLGGPNFVANVSIYNRVDKFSERLQNFYVLVSIEPFVSDRLQDLLKDPLVFKTHYMYVDKVVGVHL
jgi:hypothetical protein